MKRIALALSLLAVGATGVVIGSTIGLAEAAPGDLRHKVPFECDLTGVQARAIAQVLIDAGCSDGAAADLLQARLDRRGDGTPYAAGERYTYTAPTSAAALIQAEGEVCFNGVAP